MNIGVRVALFVVVPLVVLTTLFGYLYHQRSRAMLREELTREGRAIALVVQIAVEDYLHNRQLADLEQLVDRITGYERVLGIRIFDTHGRVLYQSHVLRDYPFRHYSELRSVYATRQPAYTRRTFGNEAAMGFVFPLLHPNGSLVGAVQVLQLESYMREDARVIRDFIVGLTVAMVLASVAIILFITRISVARPIERLVGRFRDVARGDLSARVRVDSEDELGPLAREFNTMCERLEATHQSLLEEQEERRNMEAHLRQAERLAGLGRLAAGLAHEIGTPLNVISGRAEALRRSVAGNEAQEKKLRIISEQIERIVEIVRDMLDFARMRPFAPAPTELAGVIEAILDLAETQLRRAGIEVEVAIPDDLPPAIADASQLQQVFLNLVLNALDAMENGGRLRVAAAPECVPRFPGGEPRSMIAVSFEDTGAGIAPEHRERVFDPFFTTKDLGKGTGLGLSVSYGIVEEHGGWIDLASEVGRGTTITIHLPAEAALAPPLRRAQDA